MNVSVFRTLGEGLGLWFPVYHPESTIVRRAPALTLYRHVFLSLSPHTCALCPMFSLDPSVVGLAPPCTCWRKDTITWLCALHTCVTWSAKSLSLFPSCTSSFLSLVEKSLSTTDLWLPATKLICSNSNFGAAALSAPMMLLCCSFASAFSTSRNPSFLSVDRLNFKIYTICRSSLIAIPSGSLPQKRFTKKDTGSRIEVVPCLPTFFDGYSHFYCLCLLCQIFLAADSPKRFCL